jgi:wobble nucleotide-excising tRNase
MIKNIPSIKSFGVFEDFRWNHGAPDFKRHNLIYGWNYSGKTTLSRAFRCFELGRAHGDFPSAQVRLLCHDGSTHDLSSPMSAPEIRVFNSDFVRENLKFDDGEAEPILVLGVEDIAKQERLKAAQSERAALAARLAADGKELEKIKSDIDKGLREYARDVIKNPLGIPNYDKTKFEPKVLACKDGPEKNLLDDAELDGLYSVFRSTDKKPALAEKRARLSPVAGLAKEAGALLGRVVAASARIERLDADPKAERWVSDGRALHEGRGECQFCGQSLPADLMEKLAGHFSADYDNLMSALDGLIKRVEAASDEQVPLDHDSSFYPEISGRHARERSALDELLRERSAALAAIAEALDAKRTKAFTSMSCPQAEDPATRIDEAIGRINILVKEHNDRTAEFDRKKDEAFGRIEAHHAAAFVRDRDYNAKSAAAASLESSIGTGREKLALADGEIRELERAISEASKGAESVNDLLAKYFGKDDLRIAVSSDKRFQIVRGGSKARNLSEGEKTAIAFSYFITRVKDGRKPLEEIVVVIDDPISSLDAGHLFNTYALIKTQLADCRQIFISTHSFEFYNLVREWAIESEEIKKPQSDWKHWSVLFLKRTDGLTSDLREIPRELLRFKSEYHYLFAQLLEFRESGPGEFDGLLSLPNVIRRFMEAFGGIMIPLSTGLKGKMGRLFDDPVERERVWKFINHYSHNTTITRSLAVPDTSECEAVVRACLDAVHRWNESYFNDLVSEVA